MDKRYRIVVLLEGNDNFPPGELELEFTAPSAEAAYAQLHAQMSPRVIWETQNEWDEDGVPMSYDAIENARAAFFKKELAARELELAKIRFPCSFCHSTGFVGTNPCQECGSRGEKNVEE